MYDRDNRQTQVIDPLNHAKTQNFDGAGNVIKTIDANNNATYYYYNVFNKLIMVKDALNETTNYTYDANCNMLTQTDGQNQTTTMTYNCRNLPVLKIDAGGIGQGGTIDSSKAVSYTYYADGTVSSMTDKNGVITSNTYDIHGRTLSTTAGTATISYTYDNNGNTLTMIDSTGTTTRTYDQLNRTISKAAPGAGTSRFQYDVTTGMPTGCIGEVTTDGKNNVNTKIFDKAGRLYQIKVGTATTTYAYYDNGNRQLLTYPNGITAEYTYYADNRLHTLANKCSGGSIINAYNYAYDNNGNMTTKLDSSGTTTYHYDELNRLKDVTTPGGKVTAYTFDASGNRATQQVTDGSNITNTMYTYNAQNQLTSAADVLSGTTNTTNYVYDNNGNTVSSHKETTAPSSGTPGTSLSLQGDGQGTYTVNKYDTFNQLISSQDQDSSSTYTYNGEGLRVGKTVTKSGTTTTTKFAYEYDKVVLELDGSGNQTAYNVYGNDMLISRASGGTTLYYLYNGHGDVVNIADSTGTIVMTYDYDPFGNVITKTGSLSNSYLYAGYQFDDETGLYYLNARYYDPVVARFESADTYTGQSNDPLSLNLYTYCHNEPVMYSDPSGNDAVTVTYNGQTVTAQVTNGVTIMPDGSRPPQGAVVTTSSGASYQMQGSSGVKVTAVPITTTNGTNTTGYVTNQGQTYTSDGTRIETGTVVHAVNGVDYQMQGDSGVAVTTVPITTPSGQDTIGILNSDNTTYNLDGSRVSSGTVVHTSGGDFMMGFGSGVPVIKSTTDVGQTVYQFNPEFKQCSNNSAKPLAGKTIVIDPGHGGDIPGAKYKYHGTTYYEKDFNLIIAFVVKNYLESLGAKVIMTRTTDVDVEEKNSYKLANESNADIFVSIHCNSNNILKSGSEVIYAKYHDEKESQDLAKHIYGCLDMYTPAKTNKYYRDKRGLEVLEGTTMPAVLVETRHMNAHDIENLIYDNKAIGNAIGMGILQYFL